MITITFDSVVTNVPSPSSYDIAIQPQQKVAERNSNGKLTRETLPDKWVINLSWEFKDPDDFYEWFNYLKTLTREYFIIDFTAPTGNIEQIEAYVSPLSAKMINMSRGTAGWWQNLSCTFVEV